MKIARFRHQQSRENTTIFYSNPRETKNATNFPGKKSKRESEYKNKKIQNGRTIYTRIKTK